MAAAQGDDESRSSETIIGRGALPFFLAAIAGAQDVINQQQYKCYSNMCSGNTLNLMMKFGSGDKWFPDVPFLIGMISHFCASTIARTCRHTGPRVSLLRHRLPFDERSSATAGTGYAIFKAVDNKMERRGSTTVIAPVVLGLFTVADILRPRFPDVRWHMFYPAMACGMVNGVSAEKAGAVTCMITGHRASTRIHPVPWSHACAATSIVSKAPAV